MTDEFPCIPSVHRASYTHEGHKVVQRRLHQFVFCSGASSSSLISLARACLPHSGKKIRLQSKAAAERKETAENTLSLISPVFCDGQIRTRITLWSADEITSSTSNPKKIHEEARKCTISSLGVWVCVRGAVKNNCVEYRLPTTTMKLEFCIEFCFFSLFFFCVVDDDDDVALFW